MSVPDHIDVTTPACSVVKDLLARVGDKWSVVIVFLLQEGPMRFNAIRRSMNGISQRMLTLTLRGLERDGLVVRRVFPTVPPQVEYELTPLGKTMIEPVTVLAGWAEEHQAEIDEARTRFDMAKV